MKKIIALVLATIICAAALFSCAKGELKKKDILDDNGNKVATGYYDGDKLVREEKVDSNGELTQKKEYNKDGNVEKVENYNLGILFTVEEYEYEKKEGEYSKNTVTYNNKGDVVSNKETKYKDSRPVEEIITGPASEDGVASVVERTNYTYNDDGTVLLVVTSDAKKIKETVLDKNDKTIYVHEFKEGSSVKSYYEKDRVTVSETYNVDGNLVIKTENEFNDEGVLSGTKSYNAKGELRDYSKYVYNEDGKLLGIHKYNADDTINSTIVYDENGSATIHDGVYLPLGE